MQTAQTVEAPANKDAVTAAVEQMLWRSVYILQELELSQLST
jgi:hypothetical protein